MDATYVTPFAHAIENVLATMLQVQVRFGQPSLKQEGEPWDDVTGSIGLTGDVTGVVAVSFPRDTAERLTSLLAGTEMSADHEDFADALGEIVNMICGNAKAKFEGKNASITCPQVFIGSCTNEVQNQGTPTIVIPCDCDCGPFKVEVTLRDAADAGAGSGAVAA